MLKAMLIDDEEIAIESLSDLIGDHCGRIEVCATANSVKEATEILKAEEMDVLFLDINMPGATGFDLLKRVPNPHRQSIVFVTAHDQYAIQAINSDASSYLLKPVDPDELKVLELRLLRKHKAFARASGVQIPSGEKRAGLLRLKHQKGFNLVNPRDVVALESDNVYTTVILISGARLVVSKGLHHFEALLNERSFMRIHRSTIINLHYLSEYYSDDGGFVRMVNGLSLEVSRRRKSDFFQRIEQMTASVGHDESEKKG